MICKIKHKTDFVYVLQDYPWLVLHAWICQKAPNLNDRVNPKKSIYTLSCRDSSFLKSDNKARWRSLIYGLVDVSGAC